MIDYGDFTTSGKLGVKDAQEKVYAEGYARWGLRLMSERLVNFEQVEIETSSLKRYAKR
jgi:hypothetical protein